MRDWNNTSIERRANRIIGAGTGVFIAIFIGNILLICAVIYVAWHFISKLW